MMTIDSDADIRFPDKAQIVHGQSSDDRSARLGPKKLQPFVFSPEKGW